MLRNRDDNFSPSCLTCPSPHGFSPPRKGGGAGMGQDISPTPWDGTGMGLDFLKPPPPPLPIPLPYPALLRVIIVNFLYPKTLLFKQTYQY